MSEPRDAARRRAAATSAGPAPRRAGRTAATDRSPRARRAGRGRGRGRRPSPPTLAGLASARGKRPHGAQADARRGRAPTGGALALEDAHHRGREPVGVVALGGRRVDDVVEDQPWRGRERRRPASGGQARTAGAACRVAGPVVGEDDVDDPGAGVGDERLDVAGEVEIGRLAVLRRDVADVDPERRRRRRRRRGSGAGGGSAGGSCRGCPGPRTIRSASAIAARASSQAATSAGVTQARSIPAVRVITDWPSTRRPSRVRAWSVSGVAAAGRTWPRTARTRFARRTPSSKSPPSSWVIAASRMFPTGCPPSGPPASGATSVGDPANRCSSTSPTRFSASASAARQRRMSPTGGIPSSSRRTPDEPPSSATATIAVRLLVCSLSPRRIVDWPVPPPIDDDPRPARRATSAGRSARPAGRRPARQERAVRARIVRYAPKPSRPTPDEPDEQPAQRIRQELEGHRVEDRPGQAAGLEVAGGLADDMGDAERRGEQADERDAGASA